MNYQNGGKVIGAGGFGCVFYPALKCKENNNKFNGISKLSLKNKIYEEDKINKIIRPIIKKIPNFSNYFLVNDIFTCNPKPLTKKDMKDLEKCIFLEKYDINKDNINKNLFNFEIINIPFGGKELYYIIENSNFFIKNFIYFNNHFFNLLKFAIIPMNNLGIIHNDIKSNNLLINLKDKNSGIKIIDFAMATIVLPKLTMYSEVPFKIRTRGIQFNLPFSTILFDPIFKNIYKEFLKNLTSLPNDLILKEFVIYYINKFFLESGHTKFILEFIFPIIFNNKESKNNVENFNNSFGFNLITDYIVLILLNFTDFNRKYFNEKEYYFNVFRKNSDIWGFLTIYSDILITAQSKSKSKYKKNNLVNFIVKYLYTTNFAIKPIKQDELLNDIKSLKINISLNTTRKLKKK